MDNDMYNPDRLQFYMKRRIQTTMIGALARMERHFGFLWGQDKDGELTPEEENFADIWDFARNEILNHGNKQMREVADDFYEYGGLFKNKYHYNFRVIPENNKNRKDN
jgi:hypothetical protein